MGSSTDLFAVKLVKSIFFKNNHLKILEVVLGQIENIETSFQENLQKI